MEEYKGIYYGDESERKFFEGGAHFQYIKLYKVLDKIAKERNAKEKEKELFIHTKNNLSNSLNKQIIKDKDACENKDEFRYQCPFLINNMCSVYEYRGIICRTFGLIYMKEGAKMQIPFCAYEGLNYSNVLDKEKDMLDADRMKELGIEAEPKAYNIHYDFLTSDKVAHAFQFEYGNKSSLIEILRNDKTFKHLLEYHFD